MASNNVTPSNARQPDFVLTHWGKRFWVVAMTPAARQWLLVNRTEILDPELPIQVGEQWAVELMSDVFWSHQPLDVMVDQDPHGEFDHA